VNEEQLERIRNSYELEGSLVAREERAARGVSAANDAVIEVTTNAVAIKAAMHEAQKNLVLSQQYLEVVRQETIDGFEFAKNERREVFVESQVAAGIEPAISYGVL
jgi:hypothetical protein